MARVTPSRSWWSARGLMWGRATVQYQDAARNPHRGSVRTRWGWASKSREVWPLALAHWVNSAKLLRTVS